MDTEVQGKIETFFDRYPLHTYTKGQVLLLNGDKLTHVHHLLKGRVKVYDVTNRGDEIILNVFKAPAFFPMSLAINNVPSIYIYEAETDIDVRSAPVGETIAFMKENPFVLYDLLARVYRGVDGLLGRMTYLMSRSAKGRLMYELLIDAERFGTLQKDGSYLLQSNEKELGARAGLSRETVSREMHKLKTEKIVEIRNKNIHVTQLALLKQKLQDEV